ncbi:Acetolactate synthase (plasmid) [halophilic archaeon DL31]|nr:Acetolactate synthase [halophilic archaeon DL31]
MTDSMIDGGMAVARVIDDAAVDTVFTLTGGHISPVLEGCDELGIDVIATRHEATAGFMAAAHGVLNREPGVCLVTAGPGHTNAYSAFTQAHEAGYPLVSLSGQYELEAEGRGALQEVDQVAMVDEISKWARQADTQDKLVDHTREALRRAVTPPSGHAHVSLPRDVLSGRDAPDAFPDPSTDTLAPIPQQGDDAAVSAAVDTLAEASRPVLFVGGGAWFADAGEQLRSFVERTGIPVFTHEESRGLIPDSHDLCFGSPIFKLNGAARRLQEADCVVLLDVDLDWRMDYGEPPMIPSPDDATIVQIDDTPEKIGEKAPADIGIVADARSALEGFEAAASERSWSRPTEWVETLTAASEEFAAEQADDLESDETPIHPGRLSADLAEVIDDETRVVFDGGNIGKWGKLAIPAEKPGRWLRLKGPFACIGYGLPTALGAKVAEPDDDVVLLTGDGSFGYHVMEIETAVRYDLPVTCVVANNSAWGSVGGGEAPTGTVLPETEFHELAEDLGGRGEVVTDPDEVKPAIGRAMASGEPAVVNVRTSNPYAPVDYPKTLKGY